MKTYFKLLRVHQWIKNGFLFLPLFFSGQMQHTSVVLSVLIGALAFSAMASFIYILNDSRDIEFDKLHPEKSKRPLASGEVSLAKARWISVVLLVLAIVISYLLNPQAMYLILAYGVLNTAYSLKLKQIPIVDIHCIALGFLIRIYTGGVISGVALSHWLIIMTYLLSLFIALAKRRDDLILKQKSGSELRKAIAGYNLDFVNNSMTLMSAVLVVGYIMYVTSAEVTQRYQSDLLFLSVIPVVMGIMRYMQITFVEEKSGSPTKVLYRDLFLKIVLLSWILFFAFLLYLKP